jgi:hypothetical protein
MESWEITVWKIEGNIVLISDNKHETHCSVIMHLKYKGRKVFKIIDP